MTPKQFKAALERVGLSHQKAGILFGKSGRTGQRWADGDYPIPEYVENFLKYMVKHGITASDIVEEP